MSVKYIQSRQYNACRDFLYALRFYEMIRQIGICMAIARSTPQGRSCSSAKTQRLTYIKPCRGGYYPPAVFAAACGYSLCRGAATRRPFGASASPGIYLFHPCRAKRSLRAACPLCRLRRQRCIESPRPTKTLRNKKVYAKGQIRAAIPQSRLPCRDHNRPSNSRFAAVSVL